MAGGLSGEDNGLYEERYEERPIICRIKSGLYQK